MLLHALAQLLGLLPQLILLPRQALELPLQFRLVHLFAVSRDITLLAIERILPPRQLTDPFERIVLVLFLPLLGRVWCLVIGFLPAPQFLIEQARQIRFGTVRAATTAGLLLPRNLAAPVFSLGLEQLIERLHLMGQRAGGIDLVELVHGATHRFDRAAHGVVARRGGPIRASAAPGVAGTAKPARPPFPPGLAGRLAPSRLL